MKFKITIWCEDTSGENFLENDKDDLKNEITRKLVGWSLEVNHVDIEESEFEDDKE